MLATWISFLIHACRDFGEIFLQTIDRRLPGPLGSRLIRLPQFFPQVYGRQSVLDCVPSPFNIGGVNDKSVFSVYYVLFITRYRAEHKRHRMPSFLKAGRKKPSTLLSFKRISQLEYISFILSIGTFSKNLSHLHPGSGLP